MDFILSQNFANAIFYFTVAAYLLAALFNWADLLFKAELTGKFSFALILLGLVANLGILLLSVIKVTPLGLSVDLFRLENQYQFVLSCVFFSVILSLLLVREYRRVSAAFVLMVVVLALFYLLALIQQPLTDFSLRNILRSWWLVGYMLTSALSYAAFAVSFAFGVIYLLKDYLGKTAPKGALAHALPALDILDELCYRLIAFGFPFFSASIILGAIWANIAWGRFWSWEAKETWSFVSWFAYVAYLHVRLLYGWRGNRSAWMSVMAFLAILFTFVGVNYFLPGPDINAP